MCVRVQRLVVAVLSIVSETGPLDVWTGRAVVSAVSILPAQVLRTPSARSTMTGAKSFASFFGGRREAIVFSEIT